MVIGLVATGVFGALPLVLTGPLAFVLLRAGAGLGAAIYDPAARGFLTDATPPDRRGEAFGLYGAAQMGGLLLGPDDRRVRGRAVRRHRLRLRVQRHRRGRRGSRHRAARARGALRAARRTRRGRRTSRPCRRTRRSSRAGSRRTSPPTRRSDPSQAMRLLNRGLIAALIINLGGYYGGGTYEVIWSLFLEGLGADLHAHRPDVRDVRAAGPAPVAARRPHRRPARLDGVHRPRVAPAGGHRHPVHVPVRSGPGRPADPHRGDRVRVPQPGPLRGRRGELAAGAVVDRAGPVRGRRARSGSSPRRSAPASWPSAASCTRSTCSVGSC